MTIKAQDISDLNKSNRISNGSENHHSGKFNGRKWQKITSVKPKIKAWIKGTPDEFKRGNKQSSPSEGTISDKSLYLQYHSSIPIQAREILVSEEKLQAKLDEGLEVFSEYIKNKKSKYSTVLEKAAIEYVRIENFYENIDVPGFESFLIPKKSLRDPTFAGKYTKDVLMKIVRRSLLELEKVEACTSGAEVILSLRKISKDPSFFLVNFDGANNLVIVNWLGKLNSSETPFHLGMGSFGVVQKVFDVSKARIAALKLAYTEKKFNIKQSFDNCLNEIEKLKKIGSTSFIDGVQNQPWAKFMIGDSYRQILGYLHRYYTEGDMFNIIEQPTMAVCDLNVQLRMIRQLYRGVKKIHDKDIIHGDIKVENILVHHDGKNYDASIADFGGAKYMFSEITSKNKSYYNDFRAGFGTVISVCYFTYNDGLQSLEAIKADNEDEWFQLLKKRDLFAVSTVAWVMITRSWPYPCIKDRLYPNTGKLEGYDYVKEQLGKRVADILLRALSEDPRDRPTVDEILEALEK
ncbi:MAG: protein kinase [Chlamydiota bacterium]|nr:protein kinase [Chlamydiota bacterium]